VPDEALSFKKGDQMAVWNIYEMAAMTTEGKLRNLARQCEQEACEWGRSFSYAGRPVFESIESGHGPDHPFARVGIVRGGYRGRQWAYASADGKQVGPKLKMKPGIAGELYSWLGTALDSVTI
jgi:hypothetical protein